MIAKSPLTVTANNESRTYGADDSGVTFGYSITGFIKGDVEDTSEVSGTLNYTHTDGTDTPSTEVSSRWVTTRSPSPRSLATR